MDAKDQKEARDLPLHFTRELGRAVTFLHRSRSRFMSERLRDYGFSGAMYLILLHIERHPGTTQDSIANHMFIDKCNVARRTKKLETLGYSIGKPTRTTAARTTCSSPRRAGSWCR